MTTFEISAATPSESKDLRKKIEAEFFWDKARFYTVERLDTTTFNVKVEDIDTDDLSDFLEDNKITHRSV